MTTGVRPIVYHRPLVSSFGDGFEATMTNRQVEIGFGSKRFHFTMRSSRFHRPAKQENRGQGASVLWRAMGYVGCASLALGLVFASGSVLRASPPVAGYEVVMPIDTKVALVKPKHKAKPRPIVRAAPITPFTPMPYNWAVSPAADSDDTGLAIERPDPDVAALPTVNGERAVAVYGTPRIVGGKSCRDVSVFVRDVEGKVSVSPTTECKAAR
ncbi:hypothetical protein FPZ24_13735 [Sphingomonas panacisoli]|uniref:Uncharacterized protein n=1 Tax=Sphingomonas panacisoli TaxID=1813879 RepID=A0A5B8LMW1_9SPHN|nr:hypothetical protein [Sphingomonas panacisoli]QDZ08400.1 hypothetical protein FPZ24_13735 [Sphingomonas panacisoli]